MLVSFFSRLYQEARDALLLFVIPIFLIALPWRFGWVLAKRLCRWLPIYNQQAQQALSHSKKILDISDERQWIAEYRVTILLDHIDLWLSILAPHRFYRHMKVHNQLPESGPFIVMGMHWGAGLPILRELHRSAPETVYILRERAKHEMQRRWFRRHYIQYRRGHLEKLFPNKRYSPGGYPRMLIKTLQAQHSILMLADVPAAIGEKSAELEMLGEKISISTGLLQLITKMNIPVVFFNVDIASDSGQRVLRLEQAKNYADQSELLEDIQAMFNQRMSEQSSAWQLWFVANHFFSKLQAKK